MLSKGEIDFRSNRWSWRTRRFLQTKKIDSMEKLAQLSSAQMLARPGIGEASMLEMLCALAFFGKLNSKIHHWRSVERKP